MGNQKSQRLAIVIDDLADNRTLFQEILQSLGIAVQTANNGKEGADLVASLTAAGTTVDVVFVDMMMPEMNGIGATQLLRSSGFTGPILAFSADVSTHTSKLAKSAGVNHYFVKTAFNRNLAIALLETYCGISVD